LIEFPPTDVKLAYPEMTEPAPTFGETVSAGFQAEQIQTDSWALRQRRENAAMWALADKMGGRDRSTFRKLMQTGPQIRADLFARAQDMMAGVPDDFIDVPLNEEDFQAQVDAGLRAEYQEQADVLDANTGNLGAETVGRLGAGVVDDSTLLSLPFGAGAGGVVKFAAVEGALGVASEAVTLPRQFDMAETLGLPDPDVATQLAFAGGLSAGLGGVLAGGARFLQYRKDIRVSGSEQRPEGVSAVDHEKMVDEGTFLLENPQFEGDPQTFPGDRGEDDLPLGVTETPNGEPPKIADFVFTRGGNASWGKNRHGYVMGRLMSSGIPPHIAAGFLGNFMVESGAGLNTRAVGDGGAAYGLAQWNDRRRALFAFASSRGKSPDDVDVQIDFVLHELQGSESRAWSKIQQASTAEEAAALISKYYERPGVPHMSRRTGYAREIWNQYSGGRVPRWDGANITPTGDVPTFGETSRGYTSEGTVTAGNDMRVDVRYEVVDASLLQRASGDLQPRDRSRKSSDEQISEIAAGLDPARLMASPEADRGAPVVGPDNIIESGNGRVAAVIRAAERHPDRYEAYRAEIEANGYEIPAGVERPVLVARRTSDLTPAARQAFVRQANTSAVARMSATERAAADAAALSEDTVRMFDGAAAIGSRENKAFSTRFLNALPQAERNALVDAAGALNKEGVQRIQGAMFARAFDAPDIIARYAETNAGELRALVDALGQAAPSFAALRADIAAGNVRADMDISGYVLDAVRLIGSAREVAGKSQTPAARVIEEMLGDIDLLEGAVAPVTIALVRRFVPNGRAVPADEIASFLTRYAEEARKVGTTDAGLFGDGPGPLQVLQAIDKAAFGDLQELGTVRGAGGDAAEIEVDDQALEIFDGGAGSKEVQELDAAAIDAMQPIEPLAAGVEDPNAALREAAAGMEMEMPDGTRVSVSEMLDDLDADDDLVAVIEACTIGKAA